MLGSRLAKRLILSVALLGSLVMVAGATNAKANDHGSSSQFSFSLGIGNGRSWYGNNSFYESRDRYENNRYQDYDRSRSLTRDADRDFRGGNDRDGNRNSWSDNNRNRESDRGSSWGRR
jgi:hypothetical protein